MSIEQKMIEFSEDQVKAIHEALLIGLTCYGEVDRVLSVIRGMEAMRKAGCKLNVDLEEIRDLRPRHPTGLHDVVGRLSEALTYIAEGAA
ncbi:MAG: hypothetical protein QM741_10895 [Rudaea sp.]|uniref:hypothetical protein n=1 Tax=Rudaea sp. TaxID=2136325 RepID=UPI0039E6C017